MNEWIMFDYCFFPFFIVLLLTTASHSCPFSHLQITFLWEPIETSVGFILFFFDHCFTSNGSNVAKSLIPTITLVPDIGHFSPLERALTLVCYSWTQVPFHHTSLFEPKVISSGISGKFFSDHSVISSGCTSAKLLFIAKPQPPCA